MVTAAVVHVHQHTQQWDTHVLWRLDHQHWYYIHQMCLLWCYKNETHCQLVQFHGMLNATQRAWADLYILITSHDSYSYIYIHAASSASDVTATISPLPCDSFYIRQLITRRHCAVQCGTKVLWTSLQNCFTKAGALVSCWAATTPLSQYRLNPWIM